jgi:NAD(P)H-dependent FMN reductase
MRDSDRTNARRLLIVFHTQGVKNERMARAVFAGATDAAISGVDVRLRRAFDADAEDLLWADGLILGTPENFGYMSGALKDFFDRTFYPCEGETEGLPFAIFIGCGNDGSGALNAIRRIANGYRFREVAEPVVVRGQLDDAGLHACRELGMTLAAGLEMEMF